MPLTVADLKAKLDKLSADVDTLLARTQPPPPDLQPSADEVDAIDAKVVAATPAP